MPSKSSEFFYTFDRQSSSPSLKPSDCLRLQRLFDPQIFFAFNDFNTPGRHTSGRQTAARRCPLMDRR
jgi:hypothetical protein